MDNQIKSECLFMSNTYAKRSTAGTGKLLLLSGLLFICLLSTACSTSISNKESMIRYAEKNYGECEFIREEEGGSGKGKYRTVYLRDKETGIEYEVTSKLAPLSIDGSSGIAFEGKNSDFNEKYVSYVMESSRDDLDKILTDNGLVMNKLLDYEYYFTDQFWEIMSLEPLDDKTAEKLANEICKTFKKYDSKDQIKIICNIYVENPAKGWHYDPSEYGEDEKVFFFDNCLKLGQYDSSSKKWESTYTAEAIEYMHDSYRQDLVFVDYKVWGLGVFMTEDQIKKYYPGKTYDDKVRAYIFEDSESNSYYAIALYKEGKAPKEFKIFKDSEDRSSGLCVCVEPA